VSLVVLNRSDNNRTGSMVVACSWFRGCQLLFLACAGWPVARRGATYKPSSNPRPPTADPRQGMRLSAPHGPAALSEPDRQLLPQPQCRSRLPVSRPARTRTVHHLSPHTTTAFFVPFLRLTGMDPTSPLAMCRSATSTRPKMGARPVLQSDRAIQHGTSAIPWRRFSPRRRGISGVAFTVGG